MNTVKIDKKNTKMIAHRGVSGLERENTCAAFVAAGNRSYYGIETDMHLTADGKFAIIHDGTPSRVAGVDINIEGESFDKIADIRLYDRDYNTTRRDLLIPELDEYIRICKRYEKVAVLELKSAPNTELFTEMIELIRSYDYIENTVFISFISESILEVRRQLPEARIQFLTGGWDAGLLGWLEENRFGLDIEHRSVNKELVDLIHSKGLEINCWTVDSKERAEALAEMGVDYITSNILE
ncbi:MAG: hypothetical protein E7623_06280 [Ruminococcaceae bacterium]|nr:hypothetical protein [Oscillospiraceae bacterium]